MTGAIAFRTAIRDALDEELSADERVILFGEDVAIAGGVFATTTGLYEKYGPFEVTEEMIFFDLEGRVQLWINPNLSKYLPNYEP